MRLAELCCSADPARADDEKNLREDQITQTERFFERNALFFDVAFRAIQFTSHARNCRACAPLAHRKLAGDARSLPSWQARRPPCNNV